MLAACLVGAGGIAAYEHRKALSAQQAEPPLLPAGPAERAVVAPLAAGSKLAEGWSVRDIHAVRLGSFRVACAEDSGHGRVDLEVALDEEGGPPPPATIGRFAIFYAAHRVDPDTGAKLATALAKVIEKNKDVAPPPGLTAFHPKPKPSQPL